MACHCVYGGPGPRWAVAPEKTKCNINVYTVDKMKNVFMFKMAEHLPNTDL